MPKSAKTNPPTALELFKKFQPKFRKIDWESAGFPVHGSSDEFYFMPTEPGGLVYSRTPHFINVKTAELDIGFTYDRTKKGGPIVQLMQCVWEAVLSGPFSGREFYADPDPRALKLAVKSLVENPRCDPEVPIKFSYDGARIKGLRFRDDMFVKSRGLEFFIPESSPEWRAFECAVALERARFEREQPRPDVQSPADQLQAALAEVNQVGA